MHKSISEPAKTQTSYDRNRNVTAFIDITCARQGFPNSRSTISRYFSPNPNHRLSSINQLRLLCFQSGEIL